MCALCMFCTKRIARHAVIIQDSSKPQEMESSCKRSHPRMFLKLTWGPTGHPIVADRFQQKNLAASVSPWFCWRAKQMRLFWTTFPAKAREHTYTHVFRGTNLHASLLVYCNQGSPLRKLSKFPEMEAIWFAGRQCNADKTQGIACIGKLYQQSQPCGPVCFDMFFLFGATR
jgi:hypothetical protein